ncbi:hypothetical protein KIN20_014578 [Parelaphostrongylus tenuis]|uniref:Uncharacterized protein n=1 Tax=Parelaphostrongylus tenuis TaxID=148309 RepID=A0AAD5QPH7_PARTN|nr:hypothetical protein KIN20_014578 [Parelaphostrongylus tenuis]
MHGSAMKVCALRAGRSELIQRRERSAEGVRKKGKYLKGGVEHMLRSAPSTALGTCSAKSPRALSTAYKSCGG